MCTLEKRETKLGVRPLLQQMATIDLGSLNLESEDHHLLNRSKSHEENVCYPTIKIVQKKEYWYKTSPKERRRSKAQLRRSQSMDFEDHPSETEETEPKVFKLLSETDIQDTGLKSFDSRDIVVSDIFVKVPHLL